MMRLRGDCVAVLALLAVAAVGCAHGATPQAWADHEKEVLFACLAASNLREARAAGKPVDFDDRIAITAVVIDGRYPQLQMKNQRGRVLCLFDRRARKAFVSDADSLLGDHEP